MQNATNSGKTDRVLNMINNAPLQSKQLDSMAMKTPSQPKHSTPFRWC